MDTRRVFVEKKAEFRVEAESLRCELNENLSLNIQDLRLLNVYDLGGFDDILLEKCRYSVFGEIVTDNVTDSCPLEGKTYLAIEYIPGQFDQRASSAVDCVHLIDPYANVLIKSSKLIIFGRELGDEALNSIRHYLINAVESREKDLSKLDFNEAATVRAAADMSGFTSMTQEDKKAFRTKWGLAMNEDDLQEVINYFRKEKRQPTETELRILDTYWSDHCRHTTFTTTLENIRIDDSFIKEEIENSLSEFRRIRTELGREDKKLCLMELATIGARYLRKKGYLDDMEQSEENNACSIYVDVDADGVKEKWLLQFKNETHNHPTEIEPFGGASTCLGGAIRDPLSGRAYVYQAMRVSGAGNIWQPVEQTINGKLPQRIISRKAAAGYSSYGNQIGLATTQVKEIFHEGYTAKRLEVGAVVGAVKAADVRRERPAPGDIILLLGGRTGRDGIGGATGSSKEHNESSLETCGSEVQKGNAPEERKLQRLFRRAEVTRLIKKSNDFGAGGVSVAIGELSDGLDIRLENVPVKYSGLNPTEIAISESQERMAVVIEAKDREEFEKYCDQENIEVSLVATVTDSGRMRMFYGSEKVADLSREFIDSAGAQHFAEACIAGVEDIDPFRLQAGGNTVEEQFCNLLSQDNVVSQKGLVEMFDSTIGRSTVLMPFGGKTQSSETQVSVQKLPVHGYTDCASMMSWGFNPRLSEWSPYHGAAYAVVDACTKIAAAGGDWSRMRFSYQEYFERMTRDSHSWGKPLSALLGALKMQLELKLASIGGKDSMSGSFENINVPPTLIAFGITTVDASKVISTDFKRPGNSIYLLRHTPLDKRMPNTEQLKRNWSLAAELIGSGKVVSAWSVGFGGVAEGLAKMSFGNALGVDVEINETDLFSLSYGSMILESSENIADAELLGKVTDGAFIVNGESISTEKLYSACFERFASVYPDKAASGKELRIPAADKTYLADKYAGTSIEHPLAYLPVFPGTNCDYDTAKAFYNAGAKVRSEAFRNLNAKAIEESIASMVKNIGECQILALCGGFSAGDEPDGSGKFIANILSNADVSRAIDGLLERGGLILGICNGFQALVKSGLLPYGRGGKADSGSPTLFRNDINRHVSRIVSTRVCSCRSPWMSSFTPGELHSIAVSHGEGKFVVDEGFARELAEKGQIAFMYADPICGDATVVSPDNPNGSVIAIEGVLSPDGHILGKMGHSERYENNLFKNIAGNRQQELFENAVNYFRNGR